MSRSASPPLRVLGLPLPARWAPQLERLQAAWARLDARERLGVGAAAAVLGLWLLVAVAVNPALRTLREAPAKLAQLETELAQMQGWAAEAKRLQAQAPVTPQLAQAALQAATSHLGPEAKLEGQGDRLTLRFANLQGEALGGWLAEARSAARARVVEAQLQRGPRGYSGSLVLSLGSPS